MAYNFKITLLFFMCVDELKSLDFCEKNHDKASNNFERV